ncbi:MAG: diphthine synthase [Candidatus Bathyarchaeia archaeon]
MTLKFIGLGLYDEYGISLKGVEEAKKSDHVYVELYTSLMPGLSIKNLEAIIGKPVKVLTRADIEECPEESMLKEAVDSDVALLVPGDPMNATTHIDLRLRAENMGIKTVVIHGSSITSAISGVTGLQSYKFGRTVTIPLPRSPIPLSPYDHILENHSRGLHTLILLDMNVENNEFLLIPQAVTQLLEMEKSRGERLIVEDRLLIGVARVGGPDMDVKAGKLVNILRHDFGPPPHSIVLPGNLHFMEKEALKKIMIED